MKQTQLYVITQVVAWLLVLAFFCLLISQRAIVVNIEYFYAAVLIFSLAIASHMVRLSFNRFVKLKSQTAQVIYLFVASLISSFSATFCLTLSVLIVAMTDFAYPIPESQRGYVITTVFGQNILNAIGLMSLWSCIYFAWIKVRQLQTTSLLLKSTQLDALVNQLNPHFLFNVLNNIRALILEDPAKARDMITKLSELLRYSLNKDKSVKVSVAHELAIVNDYISLCKIQFEEKLQFKSVIELNTQEYVVPQMIIQLCVENAVKHGIERNHNGGTIKLTINRRDHRINIVVENTGVIQTGNSKGNKHNTKLGISNIKKRLQLLYDGEASFSQIQQHNSVITTIALPLEQNHS